MEPIKRKFRITIEKEIEVTLTEKMFGSMSEEEFIKEWCGFLWEIDSIEDVAKHAAETAACFGGGYTYDGLGLLNDSDYPRPPDVYFDIIDEYVEAEAI